jgi:23S rRNA (adenine2030-N6)-methyltransferase
LLKALDHGLQRFATGTFLLWHAAKDKLAVAEYEDALSALPAKVLRASLCVRDDGVTSGLSTSGMVIVNPPWTLEQDLSELLPWLAESLAQGAGATWQLDRLAGQF